MAAATTSSPHFDLTNLISLQRQYALDLTNIPIDAASPASTSAIVSLKNNLNDLKTNLESSQDGSQAVIYKQKLVNDIIDTETKRLNDKKENINTAIKGQKRMIALNDNYQKRYSAYTKMIIAFTVGLVIFIFMNKLMTMLPFIPPIVFYIIIIVVLGTIVIYIYLLWIDIQRREKTNFDELALPAPDLTGTPSSNTGAAAPAPVSGVAGISSADNTCACSSAASATS